MKIHGAAAYGTASGKRKQGMAASCQERSQHERRGTHFPDELFGCFIEIDPGRLPDYHFVAVKVYGASQMPQEIGHGIHIIKIGNAPEAQMPPVKKQSRRHNGKSCIFRTLGGKTASKRVPTFNNKFLLSQFASPYSIQNNTKVQQRPQNL
jgi:hypothetical protein